MIYEEFIGEEDVDEQLAAALPAILFAREIRCDDPHIAGVVVRHRQLQQEETGCLCQWQSDDRGVYGTAADIPGRIGLEGVIPPRSVIRYTAWCIWII